MVEVRAKGPSKKPSTKELELSESDLPQLYSSSSVTIYDEMCDIGTDFPLFI